MTPMRVLVTGATGFIGRHAALRLRDEGCDVVAHGRDAAALRMLQAQGFQTWPADLADEVLPALADGLDAIVHAAALSAPWGPRAAFIATNADGTRRLLDAARARGVRRIVHLSSPSIYFRNADQYDVGEAFAPPARWITPYAESKWRAEGHVRAACARGMCAVILRPRAVFGAGDRAIVPRILARARGGRFPLVAGGRALIDATHVDNLVDAIVLSLARCAPGDAATFNISNGEPMPVKALLHLLFDALGLRVAYRSMPRGPAMAAAALAERVAARLPGRPEPPISRYMLGVLAYSQTLDIRAARRELGYAPRVSLHEGMARLARDMDAPASQ